MMRQEFENLVGCEIPASLYSSIDLDYMGTEETKSEYTARVFGKCKRPADVLNKFVAHLCADNRRALRGNPTATEDRLRDMDATILSHYSWTLTDHTWKP